MGTSLSLVESATGPWCSFAMLTFLLFFSGMIEVGVAGIGEVGVVGMGEVGVVGMGEVGVVGVGVDIARMSVDCCSKLV